MQAVEKISLLHDPPKKKKVLCSTQISLSLHDRPIGDRHVEESIGTALHFQVTLAKANTPNSKFSVQPNNTAFIWTGWHFDCNWRVMDLEIYYYLLHYTKLSLENKKRKKLETFSISFFRSCKWRWEIKGNFLIS